MAAPDTINAWMQALGGRRFLLCVGSGFVNVGLLVAHYIDQATFQTLILGTIGAYIVGNSWEYHGPNHQPTDEVRR